MYNRIVIQHSEQGLFVGTALGLAFWSNLDAVEQERVVCFESKDQAILYLGTWAIEHNPETDYEYTIVKCQHPEYVTFQELLRCRSIPQNTILPLVDSYLLREGELSEC